MPTPYPRELRDDGVRVAKNREPGCLCGRSRRTSGSVSRVCRT